MVFTTFRNLILAILFAGLLGFPLRASSALQSAAVDLVSPGICPTGGCAAGQRLNFKVDFSADKLVTGGTQNDLMVCMYAPQNWAVDHFEFTSTGSVSGKVYDANNTNCESLSEYTPLGAISHFTLPVTFGDSLSFSLRIGKSATAGASPSAILVRVYVMDANSNWSKVSEATRAIQVMPTAAQVYVANDAAGCAGQSPCYLNSLDDKTDGLGTGLKDAIDAAPAPAQITVLGNYTVKQNTVLIDKPHIIQGSGTSGITASGATCDQAVLKISAAATIRGLTIDDGDCSNPNRDLIWVADPNTEVNPVTIESNDLMDGEDAIHIVTSNKASVNLRFNHISGNNAYAIYMDTANTGVLDASANNLYANRAGYQVECNGTAKGKVDHNFWGVGVTADLSVSHCTVDNTLRMGAAILRNTATPGVQAQAVTAKATTQYIFNNGIGFQHGGTGSDFGLVIVNHGQGTNDNIPFTPGQIGTPFGCGNFYDVFLADATPPGDGVLLNLFFSYDLNATCTTKIESVQYCGQTTNMAVYPLWWYDTDQSAWKTTGSPGGQTTTCAVDRKEVEVSIKTGARPDYTDLKHMPIAAGLPIQPMAVVFSSLTAEPGNNQAKVLWISSTEINIGGYILQRSTQAATGFTDISNIARQGSGAGGANYTYTDTGLTNFTQYYYRLRVVGLDGTIIDSNVVPVTPIPPTPTITPTRTITPIWTRTLTRFPTSTFIYRSPTPTPTRTATPTSPFQTITNTPLAAATSLTQAATSLTQAATKPGYPQPNGTATLVTVTIDPGTALAETRAARTAIVKLSQTPTPTTVPEPTTAGGGPLTILMAVLAVGALAGGAVYLIREQQAAHHNTP